MAQWNLYRLKECMKRAARGEELTIGFLGGSITQGSLASKHEYTYAYRVFSWWKETFPKGKFYYVNGGIGGTTSHYGVARATTDLLMYQPDFVVVDFSVNDEANIFFQETFEGVIRKILACSSKPAVLLLNNVFYDTGENAQEYHNAVGDWYSIPHVSIRDTIYLKMQEGKFAREELTSDGLHPNDKGHRLVAEEVIMFLQAVKDQIDVPMQDLCLRGPMTMNTYERARRLTIREIYPQLAGFRVDTEEKKGHLDHFKNGWIGKKSGDRILFEIEASNIAVQYRKSVKGPVALAKAFLDNDYLHPVVLDGNFEDGWGDCLYLQVLLHHGTFRKHTVEIVIDVDAQKEVIPFYLMALIVA